MDHFLWKRMGLEKIFSDIANKKKLRIPYERALLAMTANRLCEPDSKLGVWHRWLSRVYLPSCQCLQLKHMYEAMDLFYEHAREIEEHIFFSIADLFNLEVDLIFYDTTTASLVFLFYKGSRLYTERCHVYFPVASVYFRMD